MQHGALDTEHPDDDTNEPEPEHSPESISSVAVRLGSSVTFVGANPTGPVSPVTNERMFTTWTTDPLPITGVVNDILLIFARVSAGRGPQAVRCTSQSRCA